MKRAFGATILLSLLFLWGCGGKKTNPIPENATASQLYKIGREYLKHKRYDKARKVFSTIIRIYPKSKYAPRAKLGIADSYFKKGDIASLTLAYNEYREFVSLYPYHPKAAYAQYMMGMCYFKQMHKPGRDQTNTLLAIEEFKKVIEKYPDTQEAQEAKKKIETCRQVYASHILHIARFYFHIKKWLGASWRLQDIIEKYPDFEKMDEVYYEYGVSLYNLGKRGEGKAFLAKVITDYPKSKWAKKARKFIKEKEEKKHGKGKTP